MSRIVWSTALVLVKRFLRSFVSRVWVEAFGEIERERDRGRNGSHRTREGRALPLNKLSVVCYKNDNARGVRHVLD